MSEIEIESASDAFVETTDAVPSFLPAGDEPLAADDDLRKLEDELLLGAGPGEATLVVEDDQFPLGRSWAFDFERGRFLRDKSLGPAETRGLHTLHGWIELALRVDRSAHPVFPDDYGMDGPFTEVGRFVEDDADLEQRITDALLFHPRIESVRRFRRATDPNDDYLAIEFEVVTTRGEVLALTEEVRREA